MPYGDLAKQAVQRFATYDDLDKHEVTIEEREEYEPHIDRGVVVFAGVDYERILREVEKEAASCCGMAATTTCHSTRPTCISSSPFGPATSRRIIGEANLRMADVT